MELIQFPCSRDAFVNARSYELARHEFLLKQYRGKRAKFNCELIGDSGAVRHKKGQRVRIIGVECNMLKLRDSSGNLIRSLFNPQCLDLIN